MTRSHRWMCVPAFFVLSALPLGAAHNRPIGDSKVIAAVPSPGYPEGIAVKGDRIYVSGPATFGNFDPAMVWSYDRDSGQLKNQFPVTISNPSVGGMRALSCIAFGPGGDLYAIEPFVGIIRMSLDNQNRQEVYSAFPPPSGPSLLNDLAFDQHGNLYVTDTFAGIIYRIPKGGGAPQVWFQDAQLVGNPLVPFGVNGIRIDKKNDYVYFSVTVRGDFSGAIYRLPLVANPTAAQLQEFHVYPASQDGIPGPDGIAFGKSGKLYVALAGSSQISVLDSNGAELSLLNGPASNGTPNPLPWANPANIAFNDSEGTLVVTNHASLVPFDPSLFAIFDVFVDDQGDPLP